MTIHLKVWRQSGPDEPGRLVEYSVGGILPEMSFLEMLDILNEQIIGKGEVPIEFDSDCREGICGTCGLVIDGVAHGPRTATTTCELRMRHFRDGQTIIVEPFRAKGFPVIKDLIVDRTAFDRIMQKGGYVSTNVGSAPDGNAIPIPKEVADKAMDAATCIGCAACVAACPNAAAALFVSAKIAQLAHLPQGHAERTRRALGMIGQADEEGFGDCSNHGECEAVCPKNISLETIAQMKRDYIRAMLRR
ncbi:MAG: succinate dehydrogenase/fumarate reductase iron-sulfur subunit [Candidatus Eisenbacteria bacterium]|nr:succinate dehydrogenase/fumarate reductase iron-sulfur subunit [Candidatus Latescibacterota bacterium]MBD3302450.1 succinate dehydrogenase/fumarate reductase iron-sulfur subunit [Candidatus Eisenbacteria bacterium]